jgi:stage II sporulation protein D
VGPLLVAAACARPAPPRAEPPVRPTDPVVATVRVALGTTREAGVSAATSWELTDAGGRALGRGSASERWTIAARDGALRVVQPAGGAAAHAQLVVRPSGSSPVVTWNGRHFRGELVLLPTDSGVSAVNRVGIEDYLKGVVPREIGVRAVAERAAIEAQAVAARSYTVARLRAARSPARAYDLVASTADQVYGGVAAEYAAASAAVEATAGLVLMYEGRIANALYHSTCGGSTAEASEVWRSRGEPYLKRVSDQRPGGGGYFCDIAPGFRWERTWTGDSLASVLERYLRSYSAGVNGAVGTVRGLAVEGRTPSGRVAALATDTESGVHRVRSNDVRYVLRSSGGDLLRSTYFSPEMLTAPDGRLIRLTVRGVGYGHGVGMCQWGAIGRSRAGHDFRAILRTYYPGTTVERAY